jgi:hypothetical protein
MVELRLGIGTPGDTERALRSFVHQYQCSRGLALSRCDGWQMRQVCELYWESLNRHAHTAIVAVALSRVPRIDSS